MPGSAMMTLRVDPELLAALKRRAAREGRSVSAEVRRLIERDVEQPRPPRAKRTSTMGMFPDFEAPTLDQLKGLRRRFSSSLSSPKRRQRSA
jgi:plasmid stability protein